MKIVKLKSCPEDNIYIMPESIVKKIKKLEYPFCGQNVGGYMMENKIEIGTKVNIHWENLSSIFGAIVVDRPNASGDTWKLYTESGEIIEVQNFCLMEKDNEPSK